MKYLITVLNRIVKVSGKRSQYRVKKSPAIPSTRPGFVKERSKSHQQGTESGLRINKLKHDHLIHRLNIDHTITL